MCTFTNYSYLLLYIQNTNPIKKEFRSLTETKLSLLFFYVNTLFIHLRVDDKASLCEAVPLFEFLQALYLLLRYSLERPTH